MKGIQKVDGKVKIFCENCGQIEKIYVREELYAYYVPKLSGDSLFFRRILIRLSESIPSFFTMAIVCPKCFSVICRFDEQVLGLLREFLEQKEQK